MARVSSTSVTITWAGAASTILAGLANTLNQSSQNIIINHPSITVSWLMDLVPLVFTFFAVLAATLFSAAMVMAVSDRPKICLATIIACLPIGFGCALAAWYLPTSGWMTGWVDMLGRVILLIGIELAIALVIMRMVNRNVNPRFSETRNS